MQNNKKTKSIKDIPLPKKKKKSQNTHNSYNEFQSQVKGGFFDVLNFIKTHSINIILILIVFGIVGTGLFFIWISSFRVPDFSAFEDRKVAQSTKIYDRTGEILLFDVNQDIKRTVITLEDMGENVTNAIVAIEDDKFYEHNGIRLKSILRAFLSNIQPGGGTQGGSTITQQIVKNTLLTTDKRISRKIKEIVVSLRIEREMSKDQILEVYLNEAPFGGSIYGVQEASTSFYGKLPQDLSIAEAAFLAALPQAPSRYSPYGNNTNLLVSRQKRVLENMFTLGFITEDEYNSALSEEVTFLPLNRLGIKAPHFVFYVREYLEQTYGTDIVEEGGLKVITTIDYEMQKEGERVVLKHALQNEELYNASNASLVAMNPQTGEILTMVGSRDYFDADIDGKFNVALAKRQPGSSFKPFIYATAFNEGYTPETVVFDVLTEFQTTCNEQGIAMTGSQSNCYHPQNYDNAFKGPINLRNALAQSRNIPAVKMLYLTGIGDALKTAKDFGIKTLGDANQYGLTLVLGGGEVRLLDMTSAYGVFATEGIYTEPVSILEVQDSQGNILESFDGPNRKRVFQEEPLRMLNSVLSDGQARVGLFGSINNFMYFGERNVAGKTGTTNNNRDAWMMGYTPNLVVGTWSGNNDNTPMTKGSSISGMLWREFMDKALTLVPNQKFTQPQTIEKTTNAAPILYGNWFGGDIIEIDSISGKLATEWTPEQTKEDLVLTDVNSILHWIDRNNPLSGSPSRNGQQYLNWQYPVLQWWNLNKNSYNTINEDDIPTEEDNIHTEDTQPDFEIDGILENFEYAQNALITIDLEEDTSYPVQGFDIFINNSYIETIDSQPYTFTFRPSTLSAIQPNNILRIVLTDAVYNSKEKEINFQVSEN